MKILVSTPKWNGKMSAVEYHRCFIPFKNNPNAIFTDNIENVDTKFLKENNIGAVWFNRNIAPLTLNPDRMFKGLRALGIKIICDIDDNWNVGFGHVLYTAMIRHNLKNSNVSQIKAADYVCVTHEHLRGLVIKELKVDPKKVIIAPNGIDPTEPQYNQEFSFNLKNLFWQGSVTHHHDLKQLAEAVNETNNKIFIAGYDPTSHYIDKEGNKVYHWEETGKLFNNKQWIYSLPTDEYMRFYKNKGLCLIPLEKNKFTVCKSNLKMLEAGWAKKPVICSGIHPYTTIGKDGVNCEFAYQKHAWVDSINYMLDNPNYADHLRFKLHEDVKENYLIEKTNQSRINLIEKICH